MDEEADVPGMQQWHPETERYPAPGRKEERRLERMEMDREIIRRSLCLEIAKLMIMFSSGYENRGTDYCGSVGPRQSGRGNTLAVHRVAAAMNNGGSRCSERESQVSD
jgi:hypothetical protein